MALLIALSGVPGAGKTTIARQLAQDINAIHIEIDLIEAAIRRNLGSLEESDRYRAALVWGRRWRNPSSAPVTSSSRTPSTPSRSPVTCG